MACGAATEQAAMGAAAVRPTAAVPWGRSAAVVGAAAAKTKETARKKLQRYKKKKPVDF